jgi:hypothetical protein
MSKSRPSVPTARPLLANVREEEDVHIALDVNAAIQETVEAKGG